MMDDYKTGVLVDSKYFLQTILEDKELSTTFRLWHTKWEIPLVVKISKVTQNSEQNGVYSLLKAEAQQWVELGMHPNLISAYFSREIDGHIFLFTEMISGTTLDRVKSRIGYNLPEVLGIALEIANGMAYLHSEGIFHGNLKPASIVIDKYSRVRITDIRWDHWEGLEMLTKRLRSPFYQKTMTPSEMADIKQEAALRFAYCPPEYFNKSPTASIPGDIYAYGVLLYELLMNSLPVYADDELEKLYMAYKKKHQEVSNKPIIQEGGRLLPSIVSLINSCLEKEPEKRPITFAKIVEVLQHIYEEVTERTYAFEYWPENTLLAMSLNNRALGHIDSKQWNEAEKILQEISHLDTSNIITSLNLNLLKLERGYFSQAEFQKQIQKFHLLNDPKIYVWEAKTSLEYGSFTHQIYDVLASLQENDDRLELLKADMCYRLGDYQKARDIYKEQSKKANRQDVWYRLGSASLALKLNKDAQNAWETGMKEDIPLWDLIVSYSMLLAMHGQWAEARKYLDKAMQNFSAYIKSILPVYTWSQVRRFVASKDQAVIYVAFSVDKRYIYAKTDDGESHIWEWPSGKKRTDAKEIKLDLPTPQTGTKKMLKRLLNVNDVAVASDGVIGVTLQGDHIVRIWDMKKAVCIHELEGHTRAVSAVAITQDGKLALSGSLDKTLRIWDVQNGKSLVVLKGHEDCIISLAVSENGKVAVSGAWDKTIRVWDLETGLCTAVLSGYKYDIITLALSSDGQIVAACDYSQTVTVWDTKSKKLLASLQGHEKPLTSVAISQDAKFILSGGVDGTVCVYEDIALRPCPCWVQATYMLESLPPLIPVGERQKSLQMEKEFQANLGNKQVLPALQAYKEIIKGKKKPYKYSLNLSQNLANIAQEKGYKQVRLEGHDLVSVFIHDSGVLGFTLPNDTYLYSLTENGTMKRWYFDDNHSDLFWQKSGLEFRCMALSSDNRNFCFGGKEGILYLWRKGYEQWVSIEGNSSSIQCIRISPDGKKAVTGSRDGTLQYWDLAREKLIADANGHQGMITDLAFSADNLFAISSSTDGTIRCWNLDNMQCVVQSQQKARPILTVAIAYASRPTLISGGLDGSIRQWSMGSGLCHNLIKSSGSPITAVYLHKDGSLVIAGDEKGTLKLWNLETRKCYGTINGHEEAITQVALSPDAEWAFSASRDNSLKMWRLHWEWKEA